MTKRIGLVLTAALGLIALGPLPAIAQEVMRPDGFGPLRIGMTQAQVDAAMGPPSDEDQAFSEGCLYYRPANAPESLLVMTEGGLLTRITVMGDGNVRTVDGIKLGDDIERLKTRFSAKAGWTPHVYAEPPAGYLIFWADGVKRGQEFYDVEGALGTVVEADQSGKVAYIHVGTPSIQYVEGCS